jgi:hypothetical protein
MAKCTAGIDHIRYITFALVVLRRQERLAQSPDYLRRVIQIE